MPNAKPPSLGASRYPALAIAAACLFPAAGALSEAPPSAIETASARPRLLVLTDIGGDPDDTQSLVRLLVHANEFDIEGLIASASGHPGELKPETTRPDLIREAIEAYGRVRDNLEKHAAGFPSAAALLEKVKSGNPRRGQDGLGAGGDTEGSRWITVAVDRDDPRPLHVAIWGGATDLAQALWRARADRSTPRLEAFLAKLRVHAISHQDDAGPWIVENFPSLFFILNARSPDDVLKQPATGPDRRLSSYRGMYLGGDESLTSREWLDAHVRSGHGPLGALYPARTWTDPNPHGALKEGDTPSWFYALPFGFGDPERPEWGGWGGRFRRASGRFYRDASETVGGVTDARAAVWRWRPAFQAEFQARMDWCVRPPAEANHPPRAMLQGQTGWRAVEIMGRRGEKIALSAAGSSDPDGQALSFRWHLDAAAVPGAGGAGSAVDAVLEPAAGEKAVLRLLEDGKGFEVHAVLEVQDGGTPPLTRYRRAVVRIES
jgi:hypothetical protein